MDRATGRLRRVRTLAAAAMTIAACQSLPDQTDERFGMSSPTEAPLASTAMPAGSPADEAPPGFVAFCLRNPSQCAGFGKEQATIILEDAVWAMLQQTNRAVNASISPEEDVAHYGQAEYWTIPADHRGDCDDYAVTKRMELMRAGLPARALRLALAISPVEERHVVLTVVTDKGDYVLDNLTDRIMPWNRTGLVWLSRQSPDNAWGWVILRGIS